MSVTSTWTGPEPNALIPALERLISAALTDTMQALQTGADAAYRGTRFAGAFRFRPTPIFREASLFNAHPLFTVVERPTKPHKIHAKNAVYLWFPWGPSKSAWARVKVVDHPGTKGKHWIDPLWNQAVADLAARLTRGWETLRVE